MKRNLNIQTGVVSVLAVVLLVGLQASCGEQGERKSQQIQPDTAKGDSPIYKGHAFGSSIMEAGLLASDKGAKAQMTNPPDFMYACSEEPGIIVYFSREYGGGYPQVYKIKAMNSVVFYDNTPNSVLIDEISDLDFFHETVQLSKKTPVLWVEKDGEDSPIYRLFASRPIGSNQVLIAEMCIYYVASSMTITISNDEAAIELEKSFIKKRDEKIESKEGFSKEYKYGEVKEAIMLFHKRRDKSLETLRQLRTLAQS